MRCVSPRTRATHASVYEVDLCCPVLCCRSGNCWCYAFAAGLMMWPWLVDCISFSEIYIEEDEDSGAGGAGSSNERRNAPRFITQLLDSGDVGRATKSDEFVASFLRKAVRELPSPHTFSACSCISLFSHNQVWDRAMGNDVRNGGLDTNCPPGEFQLARAELLAFGDILKQAKKALTEAAHALTKAAHALDCGRALITAAAHAA